MREAPPVELLLFDVAGEVLRSMVDPELGPFQVRAREYGIKVWFGAPSKPGREHYEAQVVGPQLVDDAKVLALELGFHAEHPKEADNDAVIDRLLAKEKAWRKTLGPDAEVDAFLGRATHWRRISETWPDPDLGDPGLGIEIAGRLVDYVTALEPLRHHS